MDLVYFFNGLFEKIPAYRKIVLLRFLIKNNVDSLLVSGFLNNGNICLCIEFKNKILGQNQGYLDNIKNEQ